MDQFLKNARMVRICDGKEMESVPLSDTHLAGLVKKNPDSDLTSREQDIVNGLIDGLSYKLIADRFDISIDTVRAHIRNIYKKLHVNSKAEVIAKSLRGEI